jgi:DNA-binding NtrC family response regulator
MKKIVILEDNKTMTLVLRSVIRKCGFEVVNFEDVETTLDNIDEINNASLFICDFDLPDGNSLVVLQKMKDNNINTPVALNSGNSGAIDAIVSRGLGELIKHNLNKEFDLKTLTNLLGQYNDKNN